MFLKRNIITNIFMRGDDIERETKKNIEKWCFSNIAYIIFCFMALLTVLVCLHNPKEMWNESVANANKHSSSSGCIVTLNNGNVIVTCSKIEMENDLVQQISDALKGEHKEILLEIKDSQLKNILESGWLSTTKFAVRKLKLLNIRNINKIGEEAFEGLPFEGLKELTIEKCNINKLSNNIFREASLINFELRCDEGTRLEIQEDFLDGMKFLSDLQLQKCNLDPENINNLFKNTKNYLRFQNLDLRFNQILELDENSFSKIQSVETFSLSYNNIRTLRRNVFQNLTFTKLLLNDNGLTTLPSGIFDYKHSQKAKIFLQGNEWDCSCDLEWLKILYLESDLIDKNNPPLCNNKFKFEEVDFCIDETTVEETTTTTTQTPTSTLTSTTPTPPPTTEGINDILTIKCVTTKKPPNGNTELYDTLTIREENIELDFYEYDYEEAIFKIVTKNNENKYKLLWFDKNNTRDISCIDGSKNEFLMRNLKRSSTYNICLISDASTVSPFDCIGFTVPVEKGERTWISRRYRTIAIGTFFGTLLACVLTGALSTYYLLRRHPNLLKCRKRIVVVKNPKDVETRVEEYRKCKSYYNKRFNASNCCGNYTLDGKTKLNYADVVEELNANRLPGLISYRQHYDTPIIPR